MDKDTDQEEQYFVKRSNGIHLVYEKMISEEAEADVTCTKLQFLGMLYRFF